MSQENADKSWYKYLESLQETSKSTFPSQRDIVLAKLSQNNLNGMKLYLLSYNCLMCESHIFEIRKDDICEHECCWACAKRIRCSESCKPLLVYALPVEDLESKREIINKYKPIIGLKIVKVGATKKRKHPKDDEMQE
ncbi:unnamed protein product [Macrosiphum euphorbiae]|uniref:Uncharacterized protein n=1 Tax=Macrosiphum euphorbiae TaxID=13131 RepID=A0AAV0VJ89_9HEMI|nr:unnamed protein product [Macrosiphum euphorbiae]